jgi:hypothetical protein
MLNWFLRLMRRPREVSPQRATPSSTHVSSDDKQISLDQGDGQISALLWTEIGNVAILTTDGGPAVSDLFWVLSAKDRPHSLIVPIGAHGEHELLQAMQGRLPGFDDMAVVEAMSSTSNGVFQIWPRAVIA